MLKSFLKIIITAVLLIVLCNAQAQTGAMPGSDEKVKPDDKTNNGSSSLKVGISYSSNSVFMGRTDTVRTPSIIPQLKYTLKSGIYFSANVELIPNRKKKKLDGGDLTAGYDHDITDDLSLGASYSKLFYNSVSTQIASSISSTFNLSLNYDISDIISPWLGIDYNINKRGIKGDFFVSPGITHDFNISGLFGDADVLLLSPTIAANAGTGNFYEAYLLRKKIRGAKRTAEENTLIAQYISQLGRFKLLDYELSAPVEYKSGHFIFQFTPTYAIVENQLPKGILSHLSSQMAIFYFETGIALKI